MGMVSEFKEFISKGNVLDLAVGVVIGAAFGKIVDSLVKDILMPPIGKVLGGVDFSNLFVILGGGGPFPSLKAAQDAGVATLNYGIFINALINFMIIAFVIFLVIKAYNRMRKPPVEVAVAPPEDVLLLREIRDSLKN